MNTIKLPYLMQIKNGTMRGQSFLNMSNTIVHSFTQGFGIGAQLITSITYLLCISIAVIISLDNIMLVCE